MDDAPTIKGSLVRLNPSDVLHIPGLGFDGLVGYSPIAMAKNAIGMAIACEEYGAKFFANGAAPGGVLEHPGTIKDPQRVRESWQSTFGGSGNSNKIAVLEEGVDAMTSPSVSDPGNVQQLAGWIQEETGGELFSIQITDPYPSDWDACLARANQERGEDARPALTAAVEDLNQYDTVFLGYPNWWYGVPMAVLTFLEENDLSGKQVYLFCSHGTGGLANSVEILTQALPNATLSDNIFDCSEEEAAQSQQAIQTWVAGLGN